MNNIYNDVNKAILQQVHSRCSRGTSIRSARTCWVIRRSLILPKIFNATDKVRRREDAKI